MEKPIKITTQNLRINVYSKRIECFKREDGAFVVTFLRDDLKRYAFSRNIKNKEDFLGEALNAIKELEK